MNYTVYNILHVSFVNMPPKKNTELNDTTSESLKVQLKTSSKAPSKATHSKTSSKEKKETDARAPQHEVIEFDDEFDDIDVVDDDLVLGDDDVESITTTNMKVSYTKGLDIPGATDEVMSEIIVVHPANRVTSERMTAYELSKVQSLRATHISEGASLFITTTETDPLKIAMQEILEKRSPLCIVRMITPTIAEVWEVNEMTVPVS